MSVFIKGAECDGCPGCNDDPCDQAPNAPASTLVCRTAAASQSKCGWDEFVTSTPPKKYRVKAQSGAVVYSNGGFTYTNTWGGNKTYATPACTTTETRTLRVQDDFCTPATDFTLNAPGQYVIADVIEAGASINGNYVFQTNACDTTVGSSNGPADSAISSSATSLGVTADQSGFSGSMSIDLSDEYTTAQLETDTTNAIPSFSGSFTNGGCTGAYYDVSTDELTITKRTMEYKFTLPTLTGFTCYRLEWNEHFAPEGGGAATDTPKSYQWDGVATETGVYTIAVPGSQGTTTITDVVKTCDCA